MLSLKTTKFFYFNRLGHFRVVRRVAGIALLAAGLIWATDGHVLHGVGPINEGMGGAGTGVCLDITGSIAWNPACTALFTGKSLDVSLEYFVPWRTLSSTVEKNALGPGFPQATLSGTTRSATDAAFLPTIAFASRDPKSRTAWHFGIIGAAGFGVDYPENTDFSNPILTPQPPNGIGFGRLRSNYTLMLTPVGFSHLLTDHVSVGISAIPAMGMLKVIPAPFAAPVMDAASGYPYYLSADKNAKAFGFGFDVGLEYAPTEKVRFGVSYHSPIWFLKFKWDAMDRAGKLHNLEFNLDFPTIVTMGVGLKPVERTTLALDVRWIDYQGTDGFKGSGFGPDGAVTGFGWRNIWVVGMGIQERIFGRTEVRAGYNYGQNPIPERLSFFNMPAPGIVQHHFAAGISQGVTETWSFDVTYTHGFENGITGPMYGPPGPIPGTSVTSRMHENSVSLGLSRRF